MNVKLIRIDAPEPVPGPDGELDVRVLLELDGALEAYLIRVRPGVLPGLDARLLVASDALQDRLRLEQHALHRVTRQVGRALRGRPVPLPQQIAA